MRIILLLIVIVAILALIQSKRHDCEWESGWFDCVIGKTMDEMSAGSPASPPDAAEPATAEPETSTPETPQ